MMTRMRTKDDPLAQARESVGFFRVVLNHEGEVGYSSSYLAAGLVTSECSTRASGYTFIAIARPTAFAPDPGGRSAQSIDVDVFLDGAFLQRSSWRKTDDAWVAWLRIDDDVRVTVSIVGRVTRPPSELTLIRDAAQT